MGRITLTASARSDLDEIWSYIAIQNFSPASANLLIDGSREKFADGDAFGLCFGQQGLFELRGEI